jgi:hypothetical protein
VPFSDALLNAALALLGIALAWRFPSVAHRTRRSGLLCLSVGALIPLLDPLRFAFTSEDQIAFLSRDPVFAGPLPGAGAVLLAAGAAVVLGAPAGRCLRWGGWTAAGLLLTCAIGGLTPGGTPWLAPWSAHRFALAVLPQGHLWALLAGGLALAASELWPRHQKTCAATGGFLLLTLLLLGLAGPVETRRQSTGLGTIRDSEPDALWPGRWLEIEVDADTYTAVARGWGSAGDTPLRVARWNEATTLLPLMEDPVVRRIYFEIFRHPVARTEWSDSQLVLTVRELSDAVVDAPGRTFVLVTDAHGRHRRYTVQDLE